MDVLCRHLSLHHLKIKEPKKSKKTELNEECIQLAAFFNSQNQDFFSLMNTIFLTEFTEEPSECYKDSTRPPHAEPDAHFISQDMPEVIKEFALQPPP